MLRFASVLGVAAFAVAALFAARFGAVEASLRGLGGLAAGLCAGCILYPALRGVVGQAGGEEKSR